MRIRRSWSPLVGLLLAGLGPIACADGGGSTNPGSPPTALIALSATADTVLAGERSDPFTVRVEDALGSALEGVPVRFAIADGNGRVAPTLAVSGSDGVAEAIYESGSTPGEARIVATVPSAENVEPVEFRVLAEPADSVSLRVTEGDGQTAEVSSQLPIPFQISVRWPGGEPAGGVAVAWRIREGRDASAVLSSDTTLTDPAGGAQVLLTLGRQPVEYRIEAFAVRGMASDTVTFLATATRDFAGNIRIDSIRPLPLVAGAEAQVFGHGFSPIASENDVRVEGESSQVLEVSDGTLRVRLPDFGSTCLPVRDVGLRVLASNDASNGELVALEPAAGLLELEVGEVLRLHEEEASCVQFGRSAAPREYRIAVASASRKAAGRYPLRLSTRVPSDLEGRGFAASITPRDLQAGQASAVNQSRAEARLRTEAVATLLERRAVPSGRSAPPRSTIIRAAVGDTVDYFFAIGSGLDASCTDTSRVVTGVVRAVRRHVVLVEDTRAPAAGYTAADWATLADEFEDVGFAADTSLHGTPHDIDSSGDVVALFTPRVNRLSPRGTGGFGGFFLPLDLARSGRRTSGGDPPAAQLCPASNEAEIIYFEVPDPDGEWGDPIERHDAVRSARGLFVHELQHLMGAQYRAFNPRGSGFGALEEVWLDEALSQIAEEVAGLRALSLPTGGDYGFDQVAGTRTALDFFNTYMADNFFNLSLYLLDPGASPSISTADPGGQSSLQMRGFGWFLLRWLADQSGDPATFLRRVAAGGPRGERGIASLEAATGREWEDLLADFGAVLAADDAGVEGLDRRFRVLTWNFRDVFASLSQDPEARARFPVPFPLQATTLRPETTAFDFAVGASTVRYFALAQGLDAPGMALSLSTRSDAEAGEAAPQLTIVRTR